MHQKEYWRFSEILKNGSVNYRETLAKRVSRLKSGHVLDA
jgi:hypothetical protein